MVSFKNESIQERIESRKKMQSSSIEVVILFLLLVVAVGGFGLMKYWQKILKDEIDIVNSQIEIENNAINSKLSGEKADFYKRTEIVEKNIYKKHSSKTILEEIEKTIVPRVVLLSFVHSIENTGSEQITITADADEYFLMAQQIEKFKENKFFSNVRASNTSRNNVGRIVFTIKASVADNDNVVYFPKNEMENSGTSESEISVE